MNGTLKRRPLALVIFALVAADWATKFWITNQLALGETRALVDGWLYFVHRQNPGVAFSLFSDLPDSWRVPFLTVLSVLGITVVVRLILSTRDPLTRLAAAAVVAGALGNVGDRLWTGQVTDFVFLAFFPFVFNLADMAITLGGSVLAFRLAGSPEPVPIAVPGGGVTPD